MGTLEGVLFFPVTPFTPGSGPGNTDVNVDALAEHLRRGLAAGPGAVFAACGTGEFHALDQDEFRRVVGTAVDVAGRVAGGVDGGGVPVFAGTGGSLPVAVSLAREAERAGANGLLLLPPYLVACPPAGLVAYVRAITAATSLPVIVYNRGNAIFTPDAAVEVARIPNVIGLKDGVGDLDRLGQIVVAVRRALADDPKPFQFFNGLPTAEVTVPAYRGIGVDLYSSAVFGFVPEVSLGFYHAVTEHDDKLVERHLAEFFHPLVRLRNKVPGYAIALIKAGVRARGLDVGGVRPPLVDPTPEHLAELDAIIAAGLAVAGS